MRSLAWLAAVACAACSSTSLNVAPVIDLSRPNSARNNPPSAASRPAAAPAVVPAPSGVAPMGEADNAAQADAQVQSVPLAAAPAVVARPLDGPPAAPLAAPAPTAPADAGAPPAAGPSAPTEAASATGAPAGAAAQQAAWSWPADGPVLVKFDAAHGKGVDIGTTEDAPVRAAADGSVSYTGSFLDYGNLVILVHGNGLRTVYGHNKSIQVSQGQTVTRGQTIALSGKTGSAAPLLHFEVRLKGVPVDPLEYLPRR